jgi:lipopolysaccharide/colanic/teichoic acid biosynthesis glycosyltransferase
MQVETLKNVPQNDLKNYLRVATISSKTALRYFYIGSDADAIDLLSESFSSGVVAENFENAKRILYNAEPNSIDIIIIDISYNEKEFKAFHAFLKNRNFKTVPVIYNDPHFQNEASINQDELIDDIIDLRNWQYDFYSKVSFLKKSKEYSFTVKPSQTKIEPDSPVFKRLFDIVVSLLLILFLLPLFLLIALAIKFESRGPIFYNANRAGRGFRIFKFYKFRTMEVNADEKIQALAHLNQYNDSTKGAKFFKISNDPRITKVGRFLRNTSLDELPQLFNVLKGDMSLVGNRPLPLYEAATLTTNEFVERFMAPAGITGLWQIKKRGKADMSIDERIELDISYARKASFLYDFWIMARTPAALFQKSDV